MQRTNWGVPVFVLILVGCALVRSRGIAEPFVGLDEWGQALFLVLARNYVENGAVHGTLPVFSETLTGPVYYYNHPWLAPVLLACWSKIVGVSEFGFRSMALLNSLAQLTFLYLLGKELKGRTIGLVACALYGFAPLSIHLGRVYGMEVLFVTFFLGHLYFLTKYRRLKTRKLALAALLFLAMAQMSDLYAVLLCPGFLLLAWYQRRETQALLFWLLCAAVPVIVSGLWLGVISYETGGQAFLSQGVGRHGPPWDYWVKLEFYKDWASKVWGGFGMLALVALGGLVFQRRWVEDFIWIALLWVPLGQALMSPRWQMGHLYFVVFFGPLFALQSAVFLDWVWRRSRLGAGLLGVVVLSLGLFLYPKGFVSENPADVATALEIRRLTTDDDLLLGLPPHMAYYVDRRSMVPYFVFVKGGFNNDPQRVYDLLKTYVVGTDYERVIVFTQFLQPPWVEVEGLDYSHALDGVESYERVTKPGIDPQVWRRRKKRTGSSNQS